MHMGFSIAPLLLILLTASAQGATIAETKLTASDGGGIDRFGTAVAISGQTALIGAPNNVDGSVASGSAYLFDTVTGAQTFKLTPSERFNGDVFGNSVAISGTTALVGAPEDDVARGAAYLFDTTTGLQKAPKLTTSFRATNVLFGWSVAVSGNTALIGAPGDDEGALNSGSAYLFNATTGAQVNKLIASDRDGGAAGDQFGYSVAISGDTALISAYGDDSGRGSVYVFNAATGAQLSKLTADDAAVNDRFGASVAISGDLALIGSPFDDDKGSGSGSVYLFDLETNTQLAKLTADDGAASDRFGVSVAVAGNIAVIGASGDSGFTGSAYLFDISTRQQIAKLSASDGASSDLFGIAVAIADRTALIGASFDDNGRGSAYVYGMTPVTVVPLPAGAWLLLTALCVLAAVGRRRIA